MIDPELLRTIQEHVYTLRELIHTLPEDLQHQIDFRMELAEDVVKQAMARVLERDPADLELDQDERGGLSGLADVPRFEDYAQPIYAEFAPEGPAQVQEPTPVTVEPPSPQQQAVDAIKAQEQTRFEARVEIVTDRAEMQAKDLARTYASDPKLDGLLADLGRAVQINVSELERKRDETVQRRIEVEVPQLAPPQPVITIDQRTF